MTAIPKTLRGALVVVISVLLVAGMPAPRAPLPDDMLSMAVLLAGEFIFGLGIGLTAAVFMAGIGLASEAASIQMGLSLGQALTPMPEAPVSGLGEFKSLMALAIYTALGGHLTMISGLASSLTVVPPGTAIEVSAGGRQVLALASTVFTTAIKVAAPVMVALLLVNIALAILSRAVPQISAFSVAFPITISIGLFVAAAALPFVGGLVSQWAERLPLGIDAVVHSFQPVAR